AFLYQFGSGRARLVCRVAPLASAPVCPYKRAMTLAARGTRSSTAATSERFGTRLAGTFARPRVHLGALVVLATVLCLARAATQPLDGDPAMYATIAKTIAATGEWTHLTFNGEPYLNKPPLHFWLNAVVFRLLGASAWTATLVPGLLGVLDVVLVYVLCLATLPGWQRAFAGALVYATTPEVVH